MVEVVLFVGRVVTSKFFVNFYSNNVAQKFGKWHGTELNNGEVLWYTVNNKSEPVDQLGERDKEQSPQDLLGHYIIGEGKHRIYEGAFVIL